MPRETNGGQPTLDQAMSDQIEPPRHPPLHRVLLFTQRFSHIPLFLFPFLLLGPAALVAWAWHSPGLGGAFYLLTLFDLAWLSGLPRFGRSYGPPQAPHLALLGLRLGLALLFSLWPAWLSIGALIQAGLTAAAVYACWVEPARLTLTSIHLQSPRLNGTAPLRLLHLSDLHLERITDRERRVLALSQELAPDVILVTGDYLNISYTLDPVAQEQVRVFLSRLRAPGGVYAVSGSTLVDWPEVVDGLLGDQALTWLRDEVRSIEVKGHRLRIVGVTCTDDRQADGARISSLLKGRTDDAFTLLLYHTPDVMPAAVEARVDLYLAGHTHGGQLRLPFFGALITASAYGKRYEMGLYREEGTTLYVNRGLGMEGMGAPRARFLCPPEVALFTLSGQVSP